MDTRNAQGPSLPTLAAPEPSEVCPPCGKCCRYVSVQVDGPTSVANVSTLLWVLYHRGVAVYQSHEEDWFLLIPAACENLLPDGFCGVYENRPFICRDYDVDGCEGTSSEPSEKLRFDGAQELLAWLLSNRSGLHARCVRAGIVPPAPA